MTPSADEPPRPRRTTLPDGTPFYCCRPFDVPAYYREVFVEAEYFRHGVTLSPGSVVFDVGANIGMFAFTVATRCPDARVFSFEPVPETYSALYWNAKERGLSGVTPFRLGLADAPRTVTFTYFPYSAGWSTMYPNWQPAFLESVENSLKAEQNMPLPLRLMMKVPGLSTLSARLMRRVQLRSVQVEAKLETLSEMIRKTNVDRIDLLKIDVERAEWDVLNGLEEAHWPLVRQMVVEVQIDHEPDNANRIRRRLVDHGFSVHEEKSNYLFGAQGEHLNSTLYAVRRA